MKAWMKFLVSLALPQVTGAAGAYFTVTGRGSWYQQIERPGWNPPGAVFSSVWITLYLLMGIAFYLVWKSAAPTADKRRAAVLWGVQLLLNFLWSYIFFGLHEIGWATVEIVVLWGAILLTIFAFAKVSRLAAWLLVPYISWVSFASILTYVIWKMN